jgi:hypothetical protein
LGAGVITKAVGGYSADSFGNPERFEPELLGHGVFVDGAVAAIAVGSVLLGPLLIPSAVARVTVGFMTFFAGITYIPGVSEVSFDLIGLGPTLWRLSWLLTVGALVGVAVARLTEQVRIVGLRAAGPIALAALLFAFNEPVWAGSTPAEWSSPFQYQRSPTTTKIANRVLNDSQTDDVVLAPEELSITLNVLSASVFSVAPRKYYLGYARDDPSFQFQERLDLSHFVNSTGPFDPRAIRHALDALSVDVVCVRKAMPHRLQTVARFGYSPAVRTDAYTCLKR